MFNQQFFFCFSSLNAVELKDHMIGTKIYILIAHLHPWGQEKHVVYLFRVVSNSIVLSFLLLMNLGNNTYRLLLYSLIIHHIVSGKPKSGELIKNVQCGYDVRKDQYVSNIIVVNTVY